MRMMPRSLSTKLPLRHLTKAFSMSTTAIPCVTGKGKYTEREAIRFAQEVTLNEGSIWLIYKHAELAIRKWVTPAPSIRALDWGCGAAKSTIWMKSLGVFDAVAGADLNESMINESRSRDPEGTYILAMDGKLPSDFAMNYDLLLSISVLVEIPTLASMRAYASEAFRVLRPGGLMVVTASTEESRDPANDYVSFSYLPTNVDTDPHNKNLKSGDPVVVQTSDGFAIEDFAWSRLDYENSFTSSGFKVLDVTRTWGDEADPFEWKAELLVPSDYVFVFQKPLEASL